MLRATVLLVAIVITVFKFIVGILSGSLGILSEALHSSLDLVAAIVTLYSVRVSDLPADADHQYGHGKVENVSAFIETGLLLLTCVWIVWEAVHRLFFHNVEIEPSVWAVLVMSDLHRARLLAFALPEARRRQICQPGIAGRRAALRHRYLVQLRWSSPASALSGPDAIYHVPWLAKADPISALGVAGIVVSVSWRLARETLDALLDAAPTGVRNEIIAQVGSVPGVLGVERVRIRKAGSRYFADVAVGLARNVTFQASDAVVSEVRQRIHRPAGRLRRAGQRRSPRAEYREHLRPHPRRRPAQQPHGA